MSSKTLNPYQVYNAALMNGWGVADTAREFGTTCSAIRAAVALAGGRVTGNGTKTKIS